MSLEERIKKEVRRSAGKIGLIEEIVAGRLPNRQLCRVAEQLYAEARTALEIKIPERIRLCPLEAGYVRAMWCTILEEESGEFKTGKDHATLFKPVCLALGLEESDLMAIYEIFTNKRRKLLEEEPSLEITVTELSQMYVDEAILAEESHRIADSLKEHYGIPEKALLYFRVHAEVDQEHSALAASTLARLGEEFDLEELVLVSVKKAVTQFPLWIEE